MVVFTFIYRRFIVPSVPEAHECILPDMFRDADLLQLDMLNIDGGGEP